MGERVQVVDLVVVGAGPAGCAAAIWAAKRGLSVQLLDRSESPRSRPGECLHPGIEAMLVELDVFDEALARCHVRPVGRTVGSGSTRRIECFGSDSAGPWRALHLNRAELDVILRKQARKLGVDLHINRSRLTPIVCKDAIAGIHHSGRTVRSAYLIDATGTNAWLTRALGRRLILASPRLTAFYGYQRGRAVDEQLFHADAVGWQWIAQVTPDVVNWTSMQFGVHKKPMPPLAVSSLAPCGGSGGADVTWRMAPLVAGPSYFVVGDAALVTDPASGNGVLRALMSGVKAAHNAVAVISGQASQAAATRDYQNWIIGWFEEDTNRLATMYDSLSGDWRTRGSRSPDRCVSAPARGSAPLASVRY